MAALNPFQKSKVDPKDMTEQEKAIFSKYGVPGKGLLQNKLKERKYFDSGDYAMSKAGKTDVAGEVGREHPDPETIPHLTTSNPPSLQPTQSQGQVASPVKEGSILQRGVSVDEQDGQEVQKQLQSQAP